MLSELSINFYLFESDSEDAFIRKVDKNIFVQTTITSYDREDLKDDTLWEQFRKNFVDWIEDDFKSEVLNIRLRRLRNALRKRDVWILKDAKMTIAKSLIRILEKEHLTFWIEEEIVNNAEKFQSDVIDHLRKIDFERNLIDYLWQTAQSRFESRKSRSARQSSLRERFTQAKRLDHLWTKKNCQSDSDHHHLNLSDNGLHRLNQSGIDLHHQFLNHWTGNDHSQLNFKTFNQSINNSTDEIHQSNPLLWKNHDDRFR
jgi:hypothetical protein